MKNLAYTLTDIEAANAPNTDPAESYVRPLGSFEHLLWLLDQANPRHFSLAAQIEGPTTVGDWRVALDHVQRRHPFFSVCIEKDRNSNPKFRQVPDRTIPLRVVRMDASQPNWLAELQREVATSFDPELAPLVRAVLMYEPHRATLILTAHHSIISAAAVSFEPNGETAFWELARFARRKLAGAQTGDGVTSAFHAIEQAVSKGLSVEAAMELAAHGFAHEAMVTNLGNLRYETSFGKFKLKALWGPAIGGSFEGGRTIGVVTVNETLHLLHTSYAPVPFLLEKIEKVLLAACEIAECS